MLYNIFGYMLYNMLYKLHCFVTKQRWYIT